jgi:branched-chain amino acid transport system substrate-binding protein
MKGYNSMMVQTVAITVFALSLITDAPAQSTIPIGLVQPLTGAFAAAGTDVVNGAKIAADEINAKGGVLGKKVELITETPRAIRRKPLQ